MTQCKFCHSFSVVKAGAVYYKSKEGEQRYLCKDCRKTFTVKEDVK